MAEGRFAHLLRSHRERAGLSQNALAVRMGTDASMVLRVERGERFPRDRAWVESAAAALRLSEDEADALLVEAGQLPVAVYRLGLERDPALTALARALADESLPVARRQELSEVVARLVAWFRAGSGGA